MKTITFPLILAAFLAACGSPEATETQTVPVAEPHPDKTLVKVRQIRPTARPIPIPATGTVASTSEIKLSFKVPGIISAIYVEEGQRIRKGQVLARINPTEINAQVRQADIALDKAERDLERARALYADTVITLEQLQDLTTARDAAQAQREIAAYNRDNAVILSTVNGRVLKKFAEKGEMVGAGIPVLYVASGKGQQVIRTALADRDIVKVQMGDPARVHFDAWPGVDFAASVTEIAATADPVTGTFAVELQLESQSREIKNGFIGKAEILPAGQEAYLPVPLDAVVDADAKGIIVFLANASRDQALIQRWNHYELTDSFAAVAVDPEGAPAVIIVEGGQRLFSGAPIECIEEEPVQASGIRH